MEIVDQKLDEVLHNLAFEKIAGNLPNVESDPLLARLGSGCSAHG